MVSGPPGPRRRRIPSVAAQARRHSHRRMSWSEESPTAPCRPLSKPTYRQATRICSRPVQPPLLDAGRVGNSPIPAFCDAIRGPESTTTRATEEPEPPRPLRLSTHKACPRSLVGTSQATWKAAGVARFWPLVCWPSHSVSWGTCQRRSPLGLSEAVLANGVTMSPPVLDARALPRSTARHSRRRSPSEGCTMERPRNESIFFLSLPCCPDALGRPFDRLSPVLL